MSFDRQAYMREYNQRPEARAKNAARSRRYMNSERGREAHKVARRVSNLLHTYGLTLDQYHALLEAQNEKCAICQAPLLTDDSGLPLRQPNVDHDHTIGHVRGLLCLTCNAGIGHLKDDVNIVRRAVAYLEKHS